MTDIQWERLSAPQVDFYDTAVLKAKLKEQKQYEKIVVGTDFIPSVMLAPYNGTINPGKNQPKPEHIQKIASKMDIWPELKHCYQELIEYVVFAEEPDIGTFNTRMGCSCGHMYFNMSGPGKIGVFVSIMGTLGSLEALAHECGHLRLRMLGIEIETHDNTLLLNGPEELFDSPIRKDKPRPMSAVLHAQYSYVMVSDMDLKYYDAYATDPQKQECARQYLKLNIPRISKGHDEVKKNIKTTDAGAKFMEGFWEYSDAVISRGLKIIG